MGETNLYTELMRTTRNGTCDACKTPHTHGWHDINYCKNWRPILTDAERLTSALVSIRERMGLYEKDFGFTESMNLDDYDQAAQGPQWNRAYGNYESLMEMRDKLKGE